MKKNGCFARENLLCLLTTSLKTEQSRRVEEGKETERRTGQMEDSVGLRAAGPAKDTQNLKY